MEDLDVIVGTTEAAEPEPSHIAESRASEARPLLVLVNPHSGKGKSTNLFRQQVAPLLKSYNIQYQLLITSSASQVGNYLSQLDLSSLSKFRGILIVSGDGLVHEAVNALRNRDDWQEAVKLPIGVVPTGSGNGLAYSLVQQKHPKVKHQKEAIEICCKQAVQGSTTGADLARVHYGPDSSVTSKTIWSFLSFGWGLLADIDVDSEWLRCFGEPRFTIYGLVRSLTSISRRAKLSYLASAKDLGQTTEDCWTHVEDKFASLYAVYLSHISKTTKFSPKSKLTDGVIYLTFIRGKLSPYKAIEFLTSLDQGAYQQLSYVITVPVSRFKLEPLEESKIVIDGEVIPWKLGDGLLDVTIVSNALKLIWTEDADITNLDSVLQTTTS